MKVLLILVLLVILLACIVWFAPPESLTPPAPKREAGRAPTAEREEMRVLPAEAPRTPEHRPEADPVVAKGDDEWHAEYLALAEGGEGEIDLDQPRSVGSLPGNYRVAQVLGPSEMIVDELGAYGFPKSGRTIWISAVDTAGWVDGKRVSFGDQVFISRGTRSYVTVLGARRTVYAVEPVDQRKYAWARDEIDRRLAARKQKESLDRASALQAARRRVTAAETALYQAKTDGARIEEYASIQARIRLYKDNPSSPGASGKLREEEAKLKQFADLSDADVTAYKVKVADLEKVLLRAKAAVKE